MSIIPQKERQTERKNSSSAFRLIEDEIYTSTKPYKALLPQYWSLALSLSASGPLHLLVLLPGMLSIQIIACHVPSFYSGTFNTNWKIISDSNPQHSFIVWSPPFLPDFWEPSFLCFLPPQGTLVCEMLINTLLFGTNRVYLQCPVF